MRKRYRSRRHNSFQLFSKNEKKAFYIIVDIITALIYVVTGILKVIPEIINYARKMKKTHYALKNIGYDYTEILDQIENKITPRQFELLMGELFKSSGLYQKVEVTQASHDFGRDIILTRSIDGFKEVTFVEIKHYHKNNYVGREICQKLLGSCMTFGVEKAIVVTTGQYHRNAYQCAAMVDNLQLMDITDIQKMILNLDSSQINRVMMKTLNAS